MNPQTKRIAAGLALFLMSSYLPSFATYVKAEAPGIAPTLHPSQNLLVDTTKVATVKTTRGEVQKAEPAGSNKTELSAWSPCEARDRLAEGTVLQTGKGMSMAELVWDKTNVTTRIFADSMVRISPAARTVYMTAGALVFRKPHNCSDEYLVETKRLQARIRGTTVRVVSGEMEDKLLVLECHKAVEVLNKINNSKVNLTPGVELVVRGAITGSLPTTTPSSQPIADLRLNPNKGELLFQDKHSKTVAYAVNGKAVLEDPFIAGDEKLSPFVSIDEIRSTMSRMKNNDNPLGNLIEDTFNTGKPDKQIVKNVKIACVPTKTSYYVGPNVGQDKAIPLPSLAYTDFMPAGIIPNVVAMNKGFQIPNNSQPRPAITQVMPRIPALSPAGEDPLAAINVLDHAQLSGRLQGGVSSFVQNFASAGTLTPLPTITQTSSTVPVHVPAVITPIAPVVPHIVPPVQAPRFTQMENGALIQQQLSAQLATKNLLIRNDALIGNLGHN